MSKTFFGHINDVFSPELETSSCANYYNYDTVNYFDGDRSAEGSEGLFTGGGGWGCFNFDIFLKWHV